MASTKGKAWLRVKDTDGIDEQRKKILVYVRDLWVWGEEPSRAEISRDTGIRLSSVCARVDELVRMGLIEVTGTKTNPETGMAVDKLSVARLWKPGHPREPEAVSLIGGLDRWMHPEKA